MRLMNAADMMQVAKKGGFALPAINANGVTYDLVRAILEAAEELHSPLIIQEYAPNLEYRGYDYFVMLTKFLGEGVNVPISISLDHGKNLESVMYAVRAGFTHIMFDYAEHPIEENIIQTNRVAEILRPLGISLEAEVGDIFISTDGSKAPVTPVEDALKFLSLADVDFLAVGVGTTHGIFKSQDTIDFEHIKKMCSATEKPLVLHGTCGVSMEDISKCVQWGMNKINFGEAIRMNYIRYFNELSETFPHEGHAWKIMQAAKDKVKEDVKEIIRAVGSEGRAVDYE